MVMPPKMAQATRGERRNRYTPQTSNAGAMGASVLSLAS
jgi:hypothetical protein